MAYGHADPLIAAFLQAQAGGMQQGARAWEQHLEEQKAAQQQQALADLLIGRQGSQPGLPGAAPGDVRGFTPERRSAGESIEPGVSHALALQASVIVSDRVEA